MDALVRGLAGRVLGALVVGYGIAPLLAAPPAARAALDTVDLRSSAAIRVALPDALREISGLATTADGRLITHGDERAIVHELDARRGRSVRTFALDGRRRGDFEGVAVVDDRLFLMTSDGWLYETRADAGRDGASTSATAYDTGLGASCELEGLAYEPSDRSLLRGCKHPRTRALRGRVTLFRWSVDRRASGRPSAASVAVSVAESAATRGTGAGAFATSAVERDPRTGHYVLVAGPQRLLAEVTPAGVVVATRRLDHALHPQPEGIAFLGDSALLIADEGGSGRATLTRYPRTR